MVGTHRCQTEFLKSDMARSVRQYQNNEINMKISLLSFIAFSLIISCQQNRNGKSEHKSKFEEVKDSLEFEYSRSLQAKISDSVTADAETGIVSSTHTTDDAADDIAIWVNKSHPEGSLVIGTNKKGGVIVFNLDGVEKAFYPTGRINNIDVLYNFTLGTKTTDIVGCTNRSDQSIDLFSLEPATGTLTDVAAGTLGIDTSILKDVYGFCFYKSRLSGYSYLFASGKNGVVQQFRLKPTHDDKIELHSVRSIRFNTQTEGLVADDDSGKLYAGEEDRGIWKLSAEPDSSEDMVLIPLSGNENTNIVSDIEGLAIYKQNRNSGFLLCSSQGNFSYAVFEREGDNRYIGSFKITDSPTVDGVEETDGIEVTSSGMGTKFPKGILVAQDGFNYKNGVFDRQNFKIIDFEKIERLISNWRLSSDKH